MFKILIISLITFMLVIIIFLIFMTFMNMDIKTNSKSIENFFNEEPRITGVGSNNREVGYCIFTNNGSITFDNETICEVLIVGGGGGGARNDDWEGGGGGGGGGVGYGTITFNNGTYNIVIGTGGEGGGSGGRTENGKNGGNSTITGGLINEIAYGGGGGGWKPGLVGGSGGGGSGHAGHFSGGSANKGNSLSNFLKANMIYYGNNGGFGFNASGGGGGGGADSNGTATGSGNYSAGNGGNGMRFSITGISTYCGGGGGGASGCYGGCHKAGGTTPGNGGLGGGGRGGDRNNPENGVENTGGGGGGSSKSNGAKGGSGIVIIKYRNISNFNTSSTDITNLFNKKKPWGMYFAEDFEGTYLIDKTTNQRNATISGNVSKNTASGNGVTGNITFISGGTRSIVSWPDGSIPTNFTILSLTRWTGGSRQRILSSPIGNWLHGHWGGRRGVCHYEYWTKGDPSIGNLDDWLCCIAKNSANIPNNILIDGVPFGQAGGGNGGYKLGINNNPWAVHGEVSDWALSCVIIWDIHLEDNEMQLLNKFINYYKNSGRPLIDIINNNANSAFSDSGDYKEPIMLSEDKQFNINNELFNYIPQYDSLLSINNNIEYVRKNNDLFIKSPNNNLTIFDNNRFNNGSFIGNGNGERIILKFKTSFVLKRILFIARERKNAPASWTINMGNSTLEGTATSGDYDAIQGKTENYCVKFYIDNTTSSDTYDINFTRTLGGPQLNFLKIILFKGEKSEVTSTAGSSIDASSTAGTSIGSYSK